MKAIKSLFLFLLLASPVFPQQIGIWKNYTTMKSIIDAKITDDGIWASSSGGVFFYNFADSSYTKFTKAEGLSNNFISAIDIDKFGNLWFGSQDGTIDVYNPVKKIFIKRILDIYNSNKSQKKINDIEASGDTMYISTDFGISLIDVNTFFFYDTFLKFGEFTSDTKVRSSFIDKVLYVATENGIARQKEGSTNLSAPESLGELYHCKWVAK